LQITANWYLHTDSSNQKRIVFLNFRKEPFPHQHQKGLLNLLKAATPESAGVGILNVQPATLVTATRLDEDEFEFLKSRAATFIRTAKSL